MSLLLLFGNPYPGLKASASIRFSMLQARLIESPRLGGSTGFSFSGSAKYLTTYPVKTHPYLWIEAELNGFLNGWTRLNDVIMGSTTFSRGLPGNKSTDFLANTGIMNFTLDNSEFNSVKDLPPVSHYAERVIADGAAGYWRLGEGSGLTAVDIIGAKNGVISGGVTLGARGAAVGDSNTAMTFDGATGKIVAPDAVGSGAFTVEVWCNWAEYPTGKGAALILNNGYWTGDKGWYLIPWSAWGTHPDGLVYFGGYTDGGMAGSEVASTVPLTLHTWHHLVGTVDAAGMFRLYVDGLPAGTPYAAPGSYNLDTFNIGSAQEEDPGIAPFKGIVDDVAIYQRALTAQEVADHYALATKPAPRNGLGYYTPGHPNALPSFAKNLGVRCLLIIEGQGFVQFTGRLLNIITTTGVHGARRVKCIAVDYMDQLARKRLVDLPLQVEATDDEVFALIVAQMTVQPRAIQIDKGFNTLQYAFDTMKAERAVPASEIGRLCKSTLRRCYVQKNGTLTFESRTPRALNTAQNVISLTPQDYRLDDGPSIEDNRDTIVNRVQATLHPRKTGETADVILFALEGTPLVQANYPFAIRGFYTEPGNLARRAGGLDMLSAVADIDYSFNTAADGTGVNVTPQVDVTTIYTANSVLFQIEAPITCYCIKLQARGTAVVDQANIITEASDDTSIGIYGENNLSLDMPYTGDVPFGQEVVQYLLFLEQQTSKRVKDVTLLLNDKPLDRQYLIAQREISDRVGVAEPMNALPVLLNEGHFINRIGLREDINGSILFDWTLCLADATQYWYLEIPGFSELGYTTRLGFGLVIGHTDAVHADTHDDIAHGDIAHVDEHGDIIHADAVHADSAHTDTPHQNVAHTDITHQDWHANTGHGDNPHSDSHSNSAHRDAHSNAAHLDIAHVNVAGHPYTNSHMDTYHNTEHYDAAHYDMWGGAGGNTHWDIPHADSHDDYHNNSHIDDGGNPHYDTPHGDGAHVDSHTNDAHGDSHADQAHSNADHGDGHGDSPHYDVNHVDAHTDAGHADAAHGDFPHDDTHSDITHDDLPHNDMHSDVAHGDAN